MKKHIVICWILWWLAFIIGLSVILYSNVKANLKFEKPIFCGSLLILYLLTVRLQHLKKIKGRLECYLGILIFFIAFILSLIKVW